MSKPKKIGIDLCYVFFCITLLLQNLSAQNIDAKLAGSDSSNAFHVINDSGDTLFTIRGDGSAEFSKNLLFNTQNYLLYVNGLNEVPPGGDGRDVEIYSGKDIYLKASEASHGMTDGGYIKINSGGSSADGDIEIKGGDDQEGYSGNVTITAGAGQDVSIYGGGFGSIGGSPGGNVNIEASKGGTNGNVSIKSGTNDGVQDAGDVIITGGEAFEARGGDIIITPGVGSSGGTDGSVIVNGSGTYTGTWTNSSDIRFKKEISPIGEALEKLTKLEGVKFKWRKEDFPEKNLDDGNQLGVIAQDVEKVIPELVKTDSEGYKSVDYSKITVLLIEALKEQQLEIEKLKEMIID